MKPILAWAQLMDGPTATNNRANQYFTYASRLQ
jgi:hypothetical protein